MKFINKLASRVTDARKSAVAFFQKVRVSISRYVSPPKPAYRLIHNARENHQICTFCVSEPLLSGDECVLSFRNKSAQPEKQTQLVVDLFAIKGVSFVEVLNYEIRVGKAEVYHWRELIKPVEAIIRKHMERLTVPDSTTTPIGTDPTPVGLN